jgi:predicted nucleic acid-binding protein
MIVVADAGPPHYLVLIEAVDVLESLYSCVLVPQAVAGELQGDEHARSRAGVDC